MLGSPVVDGGPAARPEMRSRTTTQQTNGSMDPEQAEDEIGGCKAAVEVVAVEMVVERNSLKRTRTTASSLDVAPCGAHVGSENARK